MKLLLPASLLLCACPVIADPPQHQACIEPFAPLDDSAPESLRAVAASCYERRVAMLFYNRAYHAEVLSDLHRLRGLHTYGTSEDEVRYHQSRMFVGLAEAFAHGAWRIDPGAGIGDLNVAYDRSIETVEYTIKGYNLVIGDVFQAR